MLHGGIEQRYAATRPKGAGWDLPGQAWQLRLRLATPCYATTAPSRPSWPTAPPPALQASHPAALWRAARTRRAGNSGTIAEAYHPGHRHQGAEHASQRFMADGTRRAGCLPWQRRAQPAVTDGSQRDSSHTGWGRGLAGVRDGTSIYFAKWSSMTPSDAVRRRPTRSVAGTLDAVPRRRFSCFPFFALASAGPEALG